MVIGMTLCNRFMICGELQEVMINIFRTHIKIKLSVSSNHQFFTVSQTIYNKWSKTKCDEILAIAPKLRPKFDGMVYAEGREYYRINKSDKPSRLFISGNITPWGNNIYYNMAFFRLSNDDNDAISIELEGQWIDGNNFLNVVDDSPRVFEINKPKQCKIGQIYKLKYNNNQGFYHVKLNYYNSNPKSNKWVLAFEASDGFPKIPFQKVVISLTKINNEDCQLSIFHEFKEPAKHELIMKLGKEKRYMMNSLKDYLENFNFQNSNQTL